MLKENYSQIPQLSCAGLYDLDQSIMVSQLWMRRELWRWQLSC